MTHFASRNPSLKGRNGFLRDVSNPLLADTLEMNVSKRHGGSDSIFIVLFVAAISIYLKYLTALSDVSRFVLLQKKMG